MSDAPGPPPSHAREPVTLREQPPSSQARGAAGPLPADAPGPRPAGPRRLFGLRAWMRSSRGRRLAGPSFLVVLRRLFRDFRRNRGLLLAGAVAYNTLLSLVPLFALLLVALSHLVDERLLIRVVALNLEFLVPGQAQAITEQVAAFLKHRDVVGGIGIAALLFFSAMAFSILEDAMAVIFHHRAPKRRHPALSAIIPYLFVMALGAGLLVVTFITGGLEALGRSWFQMLGHAWSLARLSRTLLHFLGMVGSTLMLTALYMVLPSRRVTFRRAIMGGLAATILWEVVRHVLVWYFRTLSLVNVVYGSLATTVIVLMTLEVAALILLLGAQVIAELERLADQRAAGRRARRGRLPKLRGT